MPDSAAPQSHGDPRDSLTRRRIAYLLTAFPTVSETFVEGEFRALSRRGLPLDFFATRNFREPAGPGDRAGDRGLVIHRSPYLLGWEIPAAALYFLFRHPARTTGAIARVLAGNARSPRYLAHALALIPKSLVFALRMKKLGTAHVHGTWAHYPATAAYLTARLLGISYSFTGHAGLDVLSDTSFLAEKLRKAAFVLTCQSATRRQMVRLVPESAGKIHLVYHGVDFSEIPPFGSLPRATPPEIVSVGRLTPEKGFLDLVEAVRRLRDRGVSFRLRIFGEGPQRPALQGEIARCGLRERVVLEGVAPHAQVLEAMARATVVTLASYRPPNFFQDGIANVLVESMACGTPVVSTEYDGSRELLEGGRLGVMVPEKDPVELARALESLLTNPGRGSELSRLGRQRTERDFDREKNVETIARLLRRTLDRDPAHASPPPISDSPEA